ncbi:MAG TPA: aminotransferase class I/II-fold pyridoxal phosphate-dependent enzyme [Steroidobacteraceae bacterium]|nr:aminotransferase class I/II-fold pyridoxal phosphate-dependent enzyme [Steroidobacteraceae bacterium]
MRIPPFALDQWLAQYEFASPPIRYNLASSTGPRWTLGELLALGSGAGVKDLGELRLSYAPPQGTLALREQVAALHDVDPDWVVITTGASEALSALYCLAAEPGASITLPFPSFPAMPVMARAWGLAVSTYALDRRNEFRQSAERVLASVGESTRLVLVNTPHNPTGSVMPHPEIARLAASLEQRLIPLVVDEVYHPLYHGAPTAASAAQLPNTIVVGDLSKALSLPGLRIGWLIDRDARRRERFIDLRSYFTISGSPLTEAVGAHALANRETILARLRSVAAANLAVLTQFMSDHDDTLGWVAPAGGTTVFPWLLEGGNARELCATLASAGVLLAPGDTFDAPEYFRLGFGTESQGFADALDIISATLRSRRTVSAAAGALR